MSDNVMPLYPKAPENKAEIEVGDIVRLGGQNTQMSVANIAGRGKDMLITCNWQDGENQLHIADFKPQQLRFVEGARK